MSQEKNVNDWLSGFFLGTLTSQDKSDLYDYLTDESHKEEILTWLKTHWEKGCWQTGEGVPSEVMFEKIMAEIEKHEALNGQQLVVKTINSRKVSKLKFASIFIRYAAVILIIFGLSWWTIKTITKPDEVDRIADILLQYNEIVVPYGSKTKIILPDSSTVWLNSGAQLKYPVVFNENQRQVYLQGEGFFEVIADSRHPFIVSSNGMSIKALGTKFNVMANADDFLIETTLVEGVVDIIWSKNETDKQSDISLKPGQKLTLRKENEQYQFENIQETGVSVDWMENRLVFEKERFEDMKIKLERWYGVVIELKDREIWEYRITGTFEKQTLEQAMEALCLAVSCSYQIEKDKVIVSK